MDDAAEARLRSLPDLLDQLRFAWKLRGLGGRGVADLTRIMTMSAADLLDDWFESDRIKAGLSIDGIIGTWAGPYEPGTAYVLLHHEIGTVDEDEADGPIGGWGFVEGGMGAVSTNLAAAVEEYGGQVRLNAPVARILAEGDRAAGVVLESGEEIRADLVISNAHPQITFLRLLEERQLPAEFVTDIRNFDSRSGTVKVNLGISELPNFTSVPGTTSSPPHRGDRAGPLDGVHPAGVRRRPPGPRLGQAVLRRRHRLDPRSDDRPGRHAHLLDVRPVGAPVVACRAAPRRGRGLRRPADRRLQRSRAEPQSSIVHRQVISPYDMEHEYGLIGGNIFHGELTLNQLFHMRPAAGYANYRTPVPSLYYASSATHAGGGVCGIPGMQAAKAAIADKKADRKATRRGRRIRRP